MGIAGDIANVIGFYFAGKRRTIFDVAYSLAEMFAHRERMNVENAVTEMSRRESDLWRSISEDKTNTIRIMREEVLGLIHIVRDRDLQICDQYSRANRREVEIVRLETSNKAWREINITSRNTLANVRRNNHELRGELSALYQARENVLAEMRDMRDEIEGLKKDLATMAEDNRLLVKEQDEIISSQLLSDLEMHEIIGDFESAMDEIPF